MVSNILIGIGYLIFILYISYHIINDTEDGFKDDNFN